MHVQTQELSEPGVLDAVLVCFIADEDGARIDLQTSARGVILQRADGWTIPAALLEEVQSYRITLDLRRANGAGLPLLQIFEAGEERISALTEALSFNHRPELGAPLRFELLGAHRKISVEFLLGPNADLVIRAEGAMLLDDTVTRSSAA